MYIYKLQIKSNLKPIIEEYTNFGLNKIFNRSFFFCYFFCKFLNNAPSHPLLNPLLPWPQPANPLRAAAAVVQHAKIIIISFWLLPRLGFNSFRLVPPPTTLTLPGNRLRYASTWTWTWLQHRRKRKRSQNATPCSRRRRRRRRLRPPRREPFHGLLLFFWCNNKISESFFFFLPLPKTYENQRLQQCPCPLWQPPLQGLLLLLLQTAAAAEHRQPFVVLNFPSFFFFLWIFINFQ